MSTYVARQPIFDQSMATFGYELLFRPGSAEGARRGTISADFWPEIDGQLAAGRSMVITGDPRFMLPRISQQSQLAETIVAIPASIPPTDDLIEAARSIERLGARIALDAPKVADLHHALLDVASLVRVNIANTSPDDWRDISQKLSCTNIQLIANDLINREPLELLKLLGYEYFEGNFFLLPTRTINSEIAPLASSRLLLLREINRDELDMDGLVKAVSTDVALTFKLLTLVNSAAIGLRQHVTSVKHAALMLGPIAIRKWAAVLVLQEIAVEKPQELMIQSLIRASFCEAVAQRGPFFDRSGDLYLLGLFSMIDALLDRPMEKVLQQLSIAPDIKDALLGEANGVSQVLDLVTAYENANWSTVDHLAGEFTQHEERIALAYRQAVAAASAIPLSLSQNSTTGEALSPALV